MEFIIPMSKIVAFSISIPTDVVFGAELAYIVIVTVFVCTTGTPCCCKER